MSEQAIARAIKNVRMVEEARNANAGRMDGCPLDLFLRNRVPDARFVLGAWSDAVYNSRRWSGAEENYLAANYGVIPSKDIAINLGRSVKSIKRKAEYMELKKGETHAGLRRVPEKESHNRSSDGVN